MIVKIKIELDKFDENYHFGLSIEFKNKLLINSEKEIHFLYEIDKILYFPFFHLFLHQWATVIVLPILTKKNSHKLFMNKHKLPPLPKPFKYLVFYLG